MPGTSSFKGRNVAVAAVVLLAVVASASLSGADAAPTLGSTPGTTLSPGKQPPGHATYADPGRTSPRAVREWAAAWNEGSPEDMAALFAEDGAYEDHAFQVEFRGRDGIAQWVSITNASIDGARVEVHEAFRRGDRIAVEWTFSGTNSAGGLAGLPPTGESFSVPAVSIFEMEGKEIRRVDDYYNLADLLRQVGLPAGAWVPPGS